MNSGAASLTLPHRLLTLPTRARLCTMSNPALAQALAALSAVDPQQLIALLALAKSSTTPSTPGAASASAAAATTTAPTKASGPPTQYDSLDALLHSEPSTATGGFAAERSLSTASTNQHPFSQHSFSGTSKQPSFSHTHRTPHRTFSSSTHSSKSSRASFSEDEAPRPLPLNAKGLPAIPPANGRSEVQKVAALFVSQGFERYVHQPTRYRPRKGGSEESRKAGNAAVHNSSELRDAKKFTEYWNFDSTWIHETNQVGRHTLSLSHRTTMPRCSFPCWLWAAPPELLARAVCGHEQTVWLQPYFGGGLPRRDQAEVRTTQERKTS